MRLAITASVLAAWSLAAFACSSDDASDAGGGSVVTDLGVCPSGYDASVGKFPHAALPTGQACNADTSCHMPIDDCPSDWTAGDAGVGEDLNEYECRCTTGTWSCTLAVKVDGVCGDAGTSVAFDAGTDASSTDASDDAPADSPIEASTD